VVVMLSGGIPGVRGDPPLLTRWPGCPRGLILFPVWAYTS